MPDENHLFELSTQIAPPKVFLVDGEEYRIRGFDHMSPNEEAKVQALFAKHARLSRRLEETVKQDQAEKVALALRDTRITLLSSLTDLPREVAEKLPLAGQIQLMNAIRAEVGGDADEEVEGAGAGSGDDEDL